MEFVVLFSVVSIICLVCNNGNKRIPRIIACGVFFLGIQLLLGLRHINYAGLDTMVYARDFVRISAYNYSIIELFSAFFKDFGYYIFAKIVSIFTEDYNIFIFISALPYTLAVTWLLYRYSRNIWLSMIMFLSYGFYLYNFQLMRHVFALGLIVLAFYFLQEGKNKLYFIMVAIATFCHAIAAVFFLAYFLKNGRITIKQFMWVVAGCVAVLIMLNQTALGYVVGLLNIMNSERFAQFATRGGSLSSDFIIQLGFVLVSLYFLKGKPVKSFKTFKNTKDEKSIPRTRISLTIRNEKYIPYDVNTILLFNMATIAIIFYAMTSVIGEFYRVAQYFSLFTIILVPNALSQSINKKMALIVVAAIAMFGIKHFFGGLFVDGSDYYPYLFFWEGAQSLY